VAKKGEWIVMEKAAHTIKVCITGPDTNASHEESHISLENVLFIGFEGVNR
jgi:hypothetical protein